MRRYILTTVFVLFLMPAGFVRGATDLSPYFQSLRGYVALFPISSEEKSNFLELIDFAEQQASNGRTDFTAVGDLLDAVLAQFAAVALQLEQSTEAVSPFGQMKENGEEPIDLFVSALDMIKRVKFQEADQLFLFPISSPSPPEGSCNVFILARTVGPVMSDPGGTLGVLFSDTVELEAQADPPGGTFNWESGPFEDIAQNISGNRLSFRALDPLTIRITVTYTGPDEEQCQDVVWVRVQGRFPEFD
jgi:hypothetical protein